MYQLFCPSLHGNHCTKGKLAEIEQNLCLPVFIAIVIVILSLRIFFNLATYWPGLHNLCLLVKDIKAVLTFGTSCPYFWLGFAWYTSVLYLF